MRFIRTKINEHHLGADGIYRIKVIEGAHIDLVSLMDDHKARGEMTDGKTDLVLYDARPYFTITPDATKYLKECILDGDRIATAVLSNKLGIRIMVNFFEKIWRTNSSIKIFQDEDKAVKWLHSIREKRKTPTK